MVSKSTLAATENATHFGSILKLYQMTQEKQSSKQQYKFRLQSAHYGITS